jgi:fumarate hydratase class II
MKSNAERSPAIVTALAPRIGYDAAAKLVHQAEEQGISLAELLEQHDSGGTATSITDALLAMTRPNEVDADHR